MRANLAVLTQAPTTIQLGEKSFRVGPFRYLELGTIQRRLDSTCRSPLALAEAATAGMAPDEAGPILEEARRESSGWNPPQVGHGRSWIDALLADLDGVVFFLGLLFGKHQDITPDDFEHILAHVGPGQLNGLFAIAMEIDPSEGEESAPK